MSFYGTHTEIHRLTRERDERDAEIDRLHELAAAAAICLRSPNVHRIRCEGEMLTRDEIAERIEALAHPR